MEKLRFPNTLLYIVLVLISHDAITRGKWSMQPAGHLSTVIFSKQGPVVQIVDYYIQRINPYPVDTVCSLSNQN